MSEQETTAFPRDRRFVVRIVLLLLLAVTLASGLAGASELEAFGGCAAEQFEWLSGAS